MTDAPVGGPGDRERVPAAFRPRVEAWLPSAGGEGDGASPDEPGRHALLEAALEALAVALRPEGRERRGAFDLLAADALLTRACEVAAAGGDPGGALEEILERVARTRTP